MFIRIYTKNTEYCNLQILKLIEVKKKINESLNIFQFIVNKLLKIVEKLKLFNKNNLTNKK